jgi:RNA polymerase sigma-70 factor (ECF subfamily)
MARGDEALQVRFAAGDDRVLVECEARYAGMLRAYVARYVGDSDRDDVVQHTFADAWRSRGRYDPSRPLEAWLLAIARRRAIDFLRRRPSGVVGLDALRGLAGEDGREVAERFAWAESVRAALAELPEVQREVLVLAYFGGLSQTQVAAQVDLPVGTVKSRMARGLQRLADILESGGFR